VSFLSVKLRSMADLAFWADFKLENQDLYTAAVRKLVELKKETVERTAKNEARYGKFSERVEKLIAAFQKGLISAAEAMNQSREVAEEVVQEDKAFEQSGLNQKAYGILKILEKYSPESEQEPDQTPLQQAAAAIDNLYQSDEEISALWQEKPQSCKKLLQKVRRIVHPLGLTDWKVMATKIDAFTKKTHGKP